jgi:hypothetical protein
MAAAIEDCDAAAELLTRGIDNGALEAMALVESTMQRRRQRRYKSSRKIH